MNLRAQPHEMRSPLRPGELGRPPAEDGSDQAAFHALRDRVHNQLLGRIDLEVMSSMKPERLREELGILVEQLLQESGAALNAIERRRMVLEIQDEVMGLGPLGASFFMWDKALKLGDARHIGILSYITPLASTALLILVSGRAFTWSIALATAMIISAAVMGMRAR